VAVITILGSIEAVDIDLAFTNSPFSRPLTPLALPLTPPILNEYPNEELKLAIENGEIGCSYSYCITEDGVRG